MNVGILENLPIILDVNERGELIDDLNVLEEVKGLFFKKADPLVIENLKKRGLLLYYDLEGTEHEYPFCWRCETPLIYKALESWFIKMSALKQELIKNNNQINWVPSHIKEGRFGEWLEDIRDWSLSRDRY
jgi:isoleucyl-tRNA synthetase